MFAQTENQRTALHKISPLLPIVNLLAESNLKVSGKEGPPIISRRLQRAENDNHRKSAYLAIANTSAGSNLKVSGTEGPPIISRRLLRVENDNHRKSA